MVQQQASGRLQRLYVRGEIVLYAHKIVHVQVYCVCLVIHTYTTRHRLIYFNKLNFLFTGYMQERMYDSCCKMCNSNMFFHCSCSALMEKHDFYCHHPLKLYSTGTVLFHCSIVSTGLGWNFRIPYFHTYRRERERVHCKCMMWCTVHFIISLFNVDNILLCVIYQLNFTVFMHVIRISRYV